MRKQYNNTRFQIRYAAIFALLVFMLVTAANPSAQTSDVEKLRDYQLIADGAGWVLIGNELFWTSNNGIDWENISPDSEGAIKSAYFTSPNDGYLVVTKRNLDTTISYELNITRDQGTTWTKKEIARYDHMKPLAASNAVHIFFLDENSGWVVIKQASSSNFNIGRIFITHDGGDSWREAPAPLGERVVFLDAITGFMAGGLYDQHLYQTTDGGMTWEAFDPAPEKIAKVNLPNLPQNGAIQFTVLEGDEEQKKIKVFQSSDLGATWGVAKTYVLDGNQTESILSAGTSTQLYIAAGEELITYDRAASTIRPTQSEILTKLSKIQMVEPGIGWAISNEYYCENSDQPDSCVLYRNLVYTSDGGINWTQLFTPPVQTNTDSALSFDINAPSSISLLPRTSFHKGQGFDQCEISSLANLQAWKNNSPFSAVNLYIGGVSRACPNHRISSLPEAKEFVETLSIQGWKFIPTWVGHQAACSIFKEKMSADPVTAEQQGRDNADDAARIAMKLGLADENKSGTVIYYDLESFYTSDEEIYAGCLKAAKAFINGWSHQLHTVYGIMAGLYGSACASDLAEFSTIENPPDVIWPAAWSADVYTSSVDAYGLPCLSDSDWGEQQRIYQYTGAHNETWGGIRMNVDLNVIDGVVADISKFVGVPSTNLENPSFESGVITPWSITPSSDDCTWSIDNAVTAWNGDNYLAISRSNNQPECTGVSQSLSFSPTNGDSYRFAVWARSSLPGDYRSLRLRITGEGELSESSNQKYSGIPNEWTCLEVEHTIQQDGLTGLVTEVLLEDSDGVELLIDDARLSLNTASLCPTVLLPTGLTASDAASIDQINLSWDEVPDATNYKVFRSETRASQKEIIGKTLSPTFTDTVGNFLDVYFYWIQACNAGKCSLFSEPEAGSFSSPFLNFQDDFEHGTTARWIHTENPSSIFICNSNPIAGAYSVCLNAATADDAYLSHPLPSSTDSMDLSFRIDPNSASLSSRTYTLLRAEDDGTIAFEVQLLQISGTYKIRIKAYNNGSYSQSQLVTITDAPTTLRVRWNSSLAHLRSINTFREISLSVNGVEKIKISGLDNSNIYVSELSWGAIVSNTSPGSGIILLDDFKYQGPLYIRQIPP